MLHFDPVKKVATVEVCLKVTQSQEVTLCTHSLTVCSSPQFDSEVLMDSVAADLKDAVYNWMPWSICKIRSPNKLIFGNIVKYTEVSFSALSVLY